MDYFCPILAVGADDCIVAVTFVKVFAYVYLVALPGFLDSVPLVEPVTGKSGGCLYVEAYGSAVLLQPEGTFDIHDCNADFGAGTGFAEFFPGQPVQVVPEGDFLDHILAVKGRSVHKVIVHAFDFPAAW